MEMSIPEISIRSGRERQYRKRVTPQELMIPMI
jgi:hypothetical protein